MSPTVGIQGITPQGIWIFVHDHEYFLSFVQYPWFRSASVNEILNVRLEHDVHLRWPDLDVDLEVASLDNPEAYPLVYR